MPLKVTFTQDAAEQITQIRAEGEAKPDKAQGKIWKALLRVLKEYLPEHGLNPSHIKKGAVLSGVRAMHVGARNRIVWLASKEKGAVIVLMIGFVKEGDREDTYEVAEREMERGRFDDAFAELEIPKPGESAPPPKRVETLPPSEGVTSDGGGAGDGVSVEGQRTEGDAAPMPVPPDPKPSSGGVPLTLS